MNYNHGVYWNKDSIVLNYSLDRMNLNYNNLKINICLNMMLPLEKSRNLIHIVTWKLIIMLKLFNNQQPYRIIACTLILIIHSLSMNLISNIPKWLGLYKQSKQLNCVMIINSNRNMCPPRMLFNKLNHMTIYPLMKLILFWHIDFYYLK